MTKSFYFSKLSIEFLETSEAELCCFEEIVKMEVKKSCWQFCQNAILKINFRTSFH